MDEDKIIAATLVGGLATNLHRVEGTKADAEWVAELYQHCLESIRALPGHEVGQEMTARLNFRRRDGDRTPGLGG